MTYYFVGDSHLGCKAFDDVRAVTDAFVGFLRSHISDADCGGIFLMGDIFDFWFEFAHSVPKGYDDVLSALKDLVSSGIAVHFIPGNHDQWTYGYLASLGLTVHEKISDIEINGKRIFLAHGHGLNCQDFGGKLVNWIFENHCLQWVFRHLVIPKLGIWGGMLWSASTHRRHNKEYSGDGCIDYYAPHTSDENSDEQVSWVKSQMDRFSKYDYIIMAHRHKGLNLMLRGNVQLVILGPFFRDYEVFELTV